MNARALAPVVVHNAGDLTVEAVERVAWGRAPVQLAPAVLETIGRARRSMLTALDAGARVYGVNTPTGYLATMATATGGDEYERNLLIGRAAGGPPYLPAAEARATIAVRLVNLASGHAGVTHGLCEALVEQLNRGLVPAVPRTQMGCAGDLIALSHAFQVLIGVGLVLDEHGAVLPAADGLAQHGLTPYSLEAKEGIALLAGAPVTTALAIARRREAALVARQALVSAACAVDALQAPLDAYSPAVGRLSGDELLADVLARLRVAITDRPRGRLVHQAPVSFRALPQVQAHLERTLGRFTRDVRRALGAVSDSPAFVDGEFVTSGEFHTIGLAAGCDAMVAALARAAEIAGQRVHRLLDHRYSRLPDQLTPQPGPRAGLVTVHKRVVGACHELRGLAAPASLGLADTSLGQEDAMTFGFEAAERLRRALDLTQQVLAGELLVARQAWWFRGTGDADGAPAPGLQAVATRLAELVEPVVADRPLGVDIELIVARLRRGELASLS